MNRFTCCFLLAFFLVVNCLVPGLAQKKKPSTGSPKPSRTVKLPASTKPSTKPQPPKPKPKDPVVEVDYSQPRLVVQLGHTMDVDSVTFSEDGSLAVTGSWMEGTAIVWDVQSGREIRRFTGNTDNKGYQDGWISGAISPDKRLVVVLSEFSFRLWDLVTGKLVKRIRITDGDYIESGEFSFSLDQTRLIWQNNISRKVWDLATGKIIESKRGKGEPDLRPEAYLSPDGKLKAMIEEKVVRIMDTTTGAEVSRLNGNPSVVARTTITPAGLQVATIQGNAVFVRDAATGRAVEVGTSAYEILRPDAKISPDGRFLAATNRGNVGIWDIQAGHQLLTLTGHTDDVSAVAYSPDSKYLITNSFDFTVRMFDLATGKERLQLKKTSNLETPIAFTPDCTQIAYAIEPDESGKLFVYVQGLMSRRVLKKLLAATDGNTWVQDIAISPDKKQMVVATSSMDDATLFDVQVWDLETEKLVRHLKGHSTYVQAVAYSADGKTIATNSWDTTIRLWNAATGAELRVLKGHVGPVGEVEFFANDQLLLSQSFDSTSRIWNVQTGAELACLTSFETGDWLVVTPDGRFDTNNPDQIRGIHWIAPDEPTRPLAPEIFLRQYYEPRLLARLLAGESLPAIPNITTLNRVQPHIAITGITPDSPQTVKITLEVARASGTIQRGAQKLEKTTGVYDVRLFRDGQLVGYAPENTGEVSVDPTTGKATLTFAGIKLPRSRNVKEVEFSAYAFNIDRVKSATSRQTFKIPSTVTPARGRAYVIAVGVNTNQHPKLNLRYAANDARRIQSTLTNLLGQSGAYEEVVPILLTSEAVEKSVENKKSVDFATKANLQAVIEALAGHPLSPEQLRAIPNATKLQSATPEDVVIFAFAGHGYADADGVFYLVPSDTGESEVLSKAFLDRCISSDELTRWLRDIDAGELTMVIDACQSAAAVEGGGFKPGPMGSRGLGQLSYDKGMRILTATQADNVALEDNRLQHGLLTYSLMHDGIEARQADFNPKDRRITLAEWLGYGVVRVPQLYEEIKLGTVTSFADNPSQNKPQVLVTDAQGRILERNEERQRVVVEQRVQAPGLFDFARRNREVVVWKAGGK